jgi:hypothetical protein
MKEPDTIDLEKIAKDGAAATVGAISVAQNMGIINDSQDLQLLIQAGIREALDQLILQLELDK